LPQNETGRNGGRLEQLEEENELLRSRLEEAEQTLDAIRSGEVDALVIQGEMGETIYALEGAERPYRIFFDQIAEGAATLSPNGTIIYTNRSLSNLLRMKDGALGGDITSFVDPGFRKDLKALIKNALKRPTEGEIPFLTKDGKTILMKLSLNGLQLGEKKFVCLTAVDLTEKKRSEKELEEAMTLLERRVTDRTVELERTQEELQKHAEDLLHRNEELKQFAYAASHDLQEPLRMIVNYLSLLERKYQCDLDPTAQAYIHHAVEGGVRMRKLIDDLLLYSRVDMGDKNFSFVDMNKVIRDTMTTLDGPIQENKVEIVVDHLPTIIAKETHMVQVMQNLVGNAIKFHGPSPPKICIAATTGEKEWKFAVSDNGIGLDMCYSDKIFQIFQRLHTKEEYPGTGVGLALVKKIIENHGGHIWVESEPGKGATFFFTIPKRARGGGKSISVEHSRYE
jgi:PAS domain S-box-containing protein